MIVLGVHGGQAREDERDPVGFALHDSAAVLIRDGAIVAAIEEERLDRIKHSNCFPIRAIRACLEIGDLPVDGIDRIAINMSRESLHGMARHLRLDDPGAVNPLDGRAHVAARLEHAFGVDLTDRVVPCNHHLSHAWSAFVPSGFDQALILSVDGDGDDRSGMVLVGDPCGITTLREFPVAHSLGHLYQRLIRVLGYNRFDEYKAMGLAPSGEAARYRGVLSPCYRLLPDGDYALEPAGVWLAALDDAGLIEHARRSGAPFEQIHKDFAAAVQDMLEVIVLHVLRHYRVATGQRRVCLAGGVAHNCTMNGVILRSGLFDEIFVQPAAHDAGGALGAAWSVYYGAHPRAGRVAMPLSLGRSLGSPAFVRARLDAWSPLVEYRESDTVAADTAQLLANGAVIGWAQGRAEFGPRALGHRSILADPRPGENRRRINRMVKTREEYRPFAPSVLIEEAGHYFDLARCGGAAPYMILVLDVLPDARAQLGATTHVDGTARVHTVSRADHPLFWDLLHAFHQLTGVPALLNTSFNNHAEPIVDSLDDAVTCFLTTGLEYLVADRFIVTKRSRDAILENLPGLVPDLLPHKTLVTARCLDRTMTHGRVVHHIASIKSRFFGPLSCDLSDDTFRTLTEADGRLRLCCLLRRVGVIDEPRRRQVLDELFELWSQRWIRFAPYVV